MKQDLQTRFSLRAFFTTLLRPFIKSKSPTDVPGLFVLLEPLLDVATWQIVIMSNRLSRQCRLERVVYCKCKQHEFLLLHFRHWNSESAVATVVIEREVLEQVPRDNSSSKLIHTSDSISPSAPETVAHDVVHVSRSSQRSTLPRSLADTYAPFTQLRTLDFPPLACPSAAQISILLSVVNQHAPNYHLYQSQCYCVSFTVWEALKTLFPDCIETHNTPIDQRSRYCGLAIQKADGVEAVCRDYGVRWRNIENEEELKRKADEAKEQQIYMSGFEQGLRLAQVQMEQDRIKAERDRMQTEINELRDRLAALSENTTYSAEQRNHA